MAEQLLPCPFCGGRASIFPVNLGGAKPLWRAECTADYCGASGMLVVAEEEKAKLLTAGHWNRRAPAQSALEELRREVEILTKERDELNDARNAAIERQNFMHTMTREAQEIASMANEHAAAALREVEALRAEREGIKAKLRDPTTVHVGMLRGDIAKPELRSLLHVYSVEAVAQFDRGAVDTARASTDEGWSPVLQPKGNSDDN